MCSVIDGANTKRPFPLELAQSSKQIWQPHIGSKQLQLNVLPLVFLFYTLQPKKLRSRCMTNKTLIRLIYIISEDQKATNL